MDRHSFLERFGAAVLGCGMLAEALLASRPEIVEEEMVTVYEYWDRDEYGTEWYVSYYVDAFSVPRASFGKLVGITEG